MTDPAILDALRAAVAYVELSTPNGTRERPPAWAILPNGDFDPVAIAKHGRDALAMAAGNVWTVEVVGPHGKRVPRFEPALPGTWTASEAAEYAMGLVDAGAHSRRGTYHITLRRADGAVHHCGIAV